MNNNTRAFNTEQFRKDLADREAQARSCWARGVSGYVAEIVDTLEQAREDGRLVDGRVYDRGELEQIALNGASSWEDYSYSGCSLVYDEDIAGRLCTPSELKRKRGGLFPPSSHESWLDVQARALAQAFNRVRGAYVRALVPVADRVAGA